MISPDDAKGMFDGLTYVKGAAVLRMLEQYLGAERFRDGIRLYLDRHRYGNTETTDLWDAIEEATGEPVRAIMDSWILQGGHPVVTAARTSEAGPTSGGGEAGDAVAGRRRRVSPSRARRQPAALPGALPLPAEPGGPRRAVAGADPGALAGGREAGASAAERRVARPAGPRRPVVVNAGGWGVFRTRYEAALFGQLIGRLGELEPIERLALVSDTWAMTQAGRMPLGEFLDLVALLGDERDPNVWDAALAAVDVLHREMPAGAATRTVGLAAAR